MILISLLLSQNATGPTDTASETRKRKEKKRSEPTNGGTEREMGNKETQLVLYRYHLKILPHQL